VALAGFLLLFLGAALALPRGLTGGSQYGRVTPIGDSYVQSPRTFRQDGAPSSGWRRVVVGLVLAAAGVILLIFGL